MDKEIKIMGKKDTLYLTIDGIAERIDILLKLYPLAVKELFKSYNLEITRDSWRNPKYEKEVLRDVVLAQLSVDLIKNKHKNEK
jgi:hypothetical protein